MKRLALIGAALALGLLSRSPANAQSAKSDVPAGGTCGTIGYDAGFAHNDTMDAAGEKCVKDASLLAAVQSPPPLGTSSGGWTPLKLPALTNTAVAIKSSGGQVGKVQCYNPNASEVFVQLYNVVAGSVVVGTTASLDIVLLGPTSTGGFTLSVQGEQFGSAISAAATTTAGGGTAPGSPVDCSVAFN